ncbi:MAG TPA: hypothetical protein VIL18_08965 [Longimicrobiales bacterium]
MARFDRMRYDYRGPEYDRRYGRFEEAYARRIALERMELERLRRERRPSRRPRMPDYDEMVRDEDLAYTRRHWPPGQRRIRRGY